MVVVVVLAVGKEVTSDTLQHREFPF